MGWLWNQVHHIFDTDDGSFPEICICGLSAHNICDAYLFIRSIASFVVGSPRILNRDTGCETGLDEVENAAKLVCEQKAPPFHFMLRSLRHEPGTLQELGVFVLDNAIALDYEKGPIWGEREIETLLQIILRIKSGCPGSFVKLEESVSTEDRRLFNEALDRLAAATDD